MSLKASLRFAFDEGGGGGKETSDDAVLLLDVVPPAFPPRARHCPITASRQINHLI